MAKKYDKEYIERCTKKIQEIIEDTKEYDDWTQFCLSVQDAVKCASGVWGRDTDEQKAKMDRFINELVVSCVLSNLTQFNISFTKKKRKE